MYYFLFDNNNNKQCLFTHIYSHISRNISTVKQHNIIIITKTMIYIENKKYNKESDSKSQTF